PFAILRGTRGYTPTLLLTDTATADIYTLSLHDALPIYSLCLSGTWENHALESTHTTRNNGLNCNAPQDGRKDQGIWTKMHRNRRCRKIERCKTRSDTGQYGSADLGDRSSDYEW